MTILLDMRAEIIFGSCLVSERTDESRKGVTELSEGKTAMYHIRPGSDEPLECGAKVRSRCHFKDEPHFETKEQAESFINDQNVLLYGEFAVASRKPEDVSRNLSHGETDGTNSDSVQVDSGKTPSYTDETALGQTEDSLFLTGDNRFSGMTPEQVLAYVNSSREARQLARSTVMSRMGDHAKKVEMVKNVSENSTCDSETLRSYARGLRAEIKDTSFISNALGHDRVN